MTRHATNVRTAFDRVFGDTRRFWPRMPALSARLKSRRTVDADVAAASKAASILVKFLDAPTD
jgi:hypothetical protein